MRGEVVRQAARKWPKCRALLDPRTAAGDPLVVKVLIVGGTRFVGYLLAWRLLARGDRLILFNRGSRSDPFGARVERIKGDRTTGELARVLEARKGELDAVVDFAAYHGKEAATAMQALEGSRAHYVLISTGQVYLVREARPSPPVGEHEYDGPLMKEPSRGSGDWEDWEYGMGKRACEDALAALPGRRWTSLRIPMVNGERDHHRRIESYLLRIIDGGPMLLPGGGEHRVRHVYGADVARAIAELLGREAAMGEAFNLAQEEQPRLVEVLAMLAALLGAPLRTKDIAREAVLAKSLALTGVSPFSGVWMSHLDPAKAKKKLGFVHTPLCEYLGRIVASWLAHPPADTPPSYLHRSVELALAR
jgi:nucleoside-diphosphate-sugar epimerase